MTAEAKSVASGGGPRSRDWYAELQQHVTDPHDQMSWWPTEKDEYMVPSDANDELQLKHALHRLADGTTLSCRGRDWCHIHAPPKASDPCTHACRTGFEAWDYGYLVKRKNRLFFLYETGDLESITIDSLQLRHLVHIGKRPSIGASPSCAPLPHPVSPRISTSSDHTDVCIISHGFSEDDGPNYPLIRTLETVALSCGYKVIVPDFRKTYAYGSGRGRSERVRVIYEEILCLDPRPKNVVLVGHSQGGAASAHACTDRVVASAHIHGLLMLGSENPQSHDGMSWVPKIPQIEIVHATGDKVIYLSDIRRVALSWGVTLTELASAVDPGSVDAWGDDIAHDFLAKDLMEQAVQRTRCMLQRCRS